MIKQNKLLRRTFLIVFSPLIVVLFVIALIIQAMIGIILSVRDDLKDVYFHIIDTFKTIW